MDPHAHPTLDVRYRPLADLRPDPQNPRVHSPKQVAQLAKSIGSFGFIVPVLIDAKGKIIAGHGRVMAAQKIGMSEVPTLCLEHLSEAQARAFLLADNKLSINSSWNERLLAENFKMLSALDLDFGLDVTGFEIPEIDLLIQGLDASGEGPDPADDPLPLDRRPVSRRGDLWQLGPHRLYCASALEEESFQQLLGDRRATAVFIDPPFNVRVDGHVSGNGAIRHREFPMASGEMTSDQFTEFLTQAVGLVARFSMDGSVHYICMDWRHLRELLAAGHAIFSEQKNLCVWDKGQGGMGSQYRSQHELILVWKHGTATHRNNVQLGKYGRYRTNVWHYPGARALARQDDEGGLVTEHPTVKPVALIADAILDCTARGDIVLDSFMGSGSTLLAAERTGRIGYGIELDPLYVDLAIRRWQRMTGGTAVHAGSGMTFAQREQGVGHV